ncbi:hypothetical protein LSTR_LSTR001760 [Laodelphax striatellus]|uniref:MADF domain-containing protein n=1 Tax=Laodelphax striatellus TaxID=195883 RepID=A0A482WGF3_LAOST|nr:hypothetical protein LSTR_LSTR001760 [Laodelphax striatellus]
MTPAPAYFNDEEDEQLIKLVRSQNFLWNLKNPDFRNKVNREATWKHIAKVLKKPRLEVQKRWKSMRDNYRRQVKEEAATGTSTRKRATYYQFMHFLDADCEGEEGSQICFVEELPLSVEMDTEADDFCDVMPATTSFTDVNSEEIASEGQIISRVSSYAEEPPAKKQKTTTSALMHHLDDSEEIQNISRTPSDGEEPSAKKQKTILFSLMNHLAESEEEKVQFKKFLQDLMSSTPQEDEIDVFFKSMAMSVKKFRPQLITKTKMKVCQLVLEMEALNQKN